MKNIKITKFIPAIAWFFVVLILLCLPGKDLPKADLFDIPYFDKFVHTGIFGVLALLFMLPFALSAMELKEKSQFFIRIAIATSIWGITTEFMQKYWIPGRSFDLLDWAADSVGASLSLTICSVKYLGTLKTGSK